MTYSQKNTLGNQMFISDFFFRLLLSETISTIIRSVEKKENQNKTIEENDNIEDDHKIKYPYEEKEYASCVKIFKQQINEDPRIKIRVELCGCETGKRLGEIVLFKVSNNESDSSLALMKNFMNFFEKMKFICQFVWDFLFDKPIVSLKTNDKGVFILKDDKFKFICKFKGYEERQEFQNFTKHHLNFFSGVLRGVFESFGIKGTISGELDKFPSVIFTITTF